MILFKSEWCIRKNHILGVKASQSPGQMRMGIFSQGMTQNYSTSEFPIAFLNGMSQRIPTICMNVNAMLACEWTWAWLCTWNHN